MLRSRSLAAFCRDQAATLIGALRARARRFGRWTPAPALPDGARPPVSDAVALRLLVGPDRVEVWRDRMAQAPFRASVLISALLHAAGFAGLAALHQMHAKPDSEPPIAITIAPADPDARVGTRAGIDWSSEADQGSVSALLDARRGAALMNELVISQPPPSRPAAARSPPPSPEAAPAHARPAPRPTPEKPPEKPREIQRAEPRPAAPAPPPTTAEAPIVEAPVGRPTEPVPAPESRPAERAPDPRPATPPLPDRRLVAEAPPAPDSAAVAPPQPAAPRATEPPSPATPPQPATTTQTAVTPNAAAPQPRGSAEKSYFDAVLARLIPMQNHPSLANLARRHVSGQVVIKFTVGRDGTVLDATVRRSSGYSFLDKAGVDLVRLASPMPTLPEALGKDIYEIEIPIRFKYD